MTALRLREAADLAAGLGLQSRRCSADWRNGLPAPARRAENRAEAARDPLTNAINDSLKALGNVSIAWPPIFPEAMRCRATPPRSPFPRSLPMLGPRSPAARKPSANASRSLFSRPPATTDRATSIRLRFNGAMELQKDERCSSARSGPSRLFGGSHRLCSARGRHLRARRSHAVSSGAMNVRSPVSPFTASHSCARSMRPRLIESQRVTAEPQSATWSRDSLRKAECKIRFDPSRSLRPAPCEQYRSGRVVPPRATPAIPRTAHDRRSSLRLGPANRPAHYR